mmetsp:Transcript_86327/g.278801  ORF Transcript_86327/g.278801 Transcript_86327/m.278801 type:complete len:295 (-) Transcript_86327:645-1529(-)|eukprot:CAMPEP_0203918832 /NCGR_PEP_ID=MMETSP0359-20131031/59330_1 /ASSEMBLY_ACC=CAM_ASM_000338 /TAXON_ID=268821 /ORGANISM="Scrippsiella Hangoei, Strain SHTV-5" /LENGTH=294 /DNA_ID=CAMNT_0050846005 /DNA_START=45 /DNA_END=929 /DNA_ORIENTATION=+
MAVLVGDVASSLPLPLGTLSSTPIAASVLLHAKVGLGERWIFELSEPRISHTGMSSSQKSLAVLMLAGSCVVGSGRRQGQRAGKVGCRCGAADTVGRSNLLRASWWPFSLKGKRTESGIAVLNPDFQDDTMGVSPEAELSLLRSTAPQKVAMLGSRECTFQHQQEIELLSEARVNRGDHVYTSGSIGTNSSVIRGALMARRPNLLTVILPQSFKKQDKDAQLLLKKCSDAGVEVQVMSENDSLPRSEAAKACNSRVLSQVKRLVAFASHESSVYLSLVEEAKRNGIVSTAFFLD